MNILLYGGAFDPIHKGHVHAFNFAKKYLSKLLKDKVYGFLVPCNNSPEDKNFRLSFEQRIDLINDLIKKNYIKGNIWDIEKTLPKKNYTYITIEKALEKWSDSKIFFLIGTDQYNKIESWKNIDRIRKNARLVIIKRTDENITKKSDDDIIIYTNKVYNCSSTDLIVNPSKKFLYKETIEKINNKGLYWEQRLDFFKISEYRKKHSIMVANLASDLAISNNLDHNDAWICGIYHDIAKDFSKDETLSFIENNMPWIKEYKSWKILHSYIGAYILEKKFLFKNKQIISGIYNHTIIEDESIFNKIIFCADKLVDRDDDSKEWNNQKNEIISLCKQDINKGYEKLKLYINSRYK